MFKSLVRRKEYEENIKKTNDAIVKMVAEINRISISIQNISNFAIVVNSKLADISARLDALEGKKTFH